MKGIKAILGIALATTGLGGAIAVGAVSSVQPQNIEQAEAANGTEQTRTVYCAVYPNWIGSNRIKVETVIGDGGQKRMSGVFTNTGKTYENRVIYSGVYTEKYGGVDAMEFHVYDSKDAWQWKKIAASSWTTNSSIENRLFIFGEDDYGSWVDYQETTVSFVDKNGTAGESLEYNTSNNQYEGVYTTSSDNEKFKLKKVTGTTTTYPVSLDTALSSDVATSDGTWITIKKASAYMVYYKADGKIWIQDAEPYLVAYAFAGYFLTNVGCDPDGVNIPSGWSTLATRYSGLSGDVKDYIYSFDVETARAKDPNDDLVAMFDRYEWAINHNPNSLSHFITNRSGTSRAISSSNSNFRVAENKNDNVLIIVSVISAISLSAAGLFFIIRKRKHN